jgi:signal transduction histidine kinase
MIIKNDAKITVECNCPHIVFSKKNFKSILYNLISNAIKYRAFDRKPEVTIVAKELEDYNLLMVEDNGLGIEDKKKSQMFTMFKRFHDHVEGTGVGLYIVKRIIDNAGGKIEVDSEVDKGTRFKVYFKK